MHTRTILSSKDPQLLDLTCYIFTEVITLSYLFVRIPLSYKFFEAIQQIGSIERTSFHKATYRTHGVLSGLTARQKEILLLAKRMGYYDYPRKINGGDLSEILGISKAATIEHLRKAESRIMSIIMAGY
jgi:predicted DNA binding protein